MLIDFKQYSIYNFFKQQSAGNLEKHHVFINCTRLKTNETIDCEKSTQCKYVYISESKYVSESDTTIKINAIQDEREYKYPVCRLMC